MTETNEYPSIRDCALAVIDAIGRDKDDPERLRTGLLDATRPFLARPDLFSLGVKRPGNHIDNSKYIYYDGELSITLDQLPQEVQRLLVLALRAQRVDGRVEGAAVGGVDREQLLHAREPRVVVAVAPVDLGQEQVPLVGVDVGQVEHGLDPQADVQIVGIP